MNFHKALCVCACMSMHAVLLHRLTLVYIKSLINKECVASILKNACYSQTSSSYQTESLGCPWWVIPFIIPYQTRYGMVRESPRRLLARLKNLAPSRPLSQILRPKIDAVSMPSLGSRSWCVQRELCSWCFQYMFYFLEVLRESSGG